MSVVASLLLAAAAMPAAAQKSRSERQLTLRDLDQTLAGMVEGSPLDFIAPARIGYGVTGQSRYDAFFRKAAVAYGGLYYGRRLVTEATSQLKSFARSKAAVASLNEEIAALTQEADTTEWTTEQSLAVLAAARKRGEVSNDEQLYMLAMSALLAATIPVVQASVQATPDLLTSGRGLTRSIPDDFDIFEAPQMALSMNRSLRQLGEIPSESSSLLESLLVLSRGFQMLSEES